MTPEQIAADTIRVERAHSQWCVVVGDGEESRDVLRDPRKMYCDNFAAALRRILVRAIERAEVQMSLHTHNEALAGRLE